VSLPLNKSAVVPLIARVFAEHKQLLEQTLMAVMLGLRLQINYLVEPVLSESETRADDDIAKYLQAAVLGREKWCETTHKVISRTGKRILFESNLITQKDWKALLDSYQAEDQQVNLR
jgi:hypothetical protein